MQPETKTPWFLTPIAITIAILCAGPFALPLVWKSPALKSWHKWLTTIIMVILTIWLLNAGAEMYKTLLKEMQSLQDVMR